MVTLLSATRTIGLAAAALAIAGCSLNPKQDPSRFYLLIPAADSGTAAAAGAADANDIGSLGVGPVRFPAYLDRPQMVTRISDVEVSVSEYERWAEPLKANFTAVLARDLERVTARVETYPYVAGVDYSVRVDVHRFERNSSGIAVLRCGWVIMGSGLTPVLSRESVYSEQAADGTTDAAVAALSRTVQRLSAEVAQALRDLPPPERDVPPPD